MLACSSLYNELRAHESFREKKEKKGGDEKREEEKSGENVLVNDCF